jgi:hypothetical protein
VFEKERPRKVRPPTSPVGLPAPQGSESLSGEAQVVDEARRSRADAPDATRQPSQQSKTHQPQQAAARSASVDRRGASSVEVHPLELGTGHEAQGGNGSKHV